MFSAPVWMLIELSSTGRQRGFGELIAVKRSRPPRDGGTTSARMQQHIGVGAQCQRRDSARMHIEEAVDPSSSLLLIHYRKGERLADRPVVRRTVRNVIARRAPAALEISRRCASGEEAGRIMPARQLERKHPRRPGAVGS